jgi:acyl carrier protein
MIDTQLKNIIINTLGADEAEVVAEADFVLDLNATEDELMEIKHQLEEQLAITLPIESAELFPRTVAELAELVNDACL